MKMWWVFWITTYSLLMQIEATIYDDDYDTYTRTNQYATSGKKFQLGLFLYVDYWLNKKRF